MAAEERPAELCVCGAFPLALPSPLLASDWLTGGWLTAVWLGGGWLGGKLADAMSVAAAPSLPLLLPSKLPNAALSALLASPLLASGMRRSPVPWPPSFDGPEAAQT